MTIAIMIDGRLVDTDDNTRLGLQFNSNLFASGGIEVAHSFGLSIPCTSRNNIILNFSELQDFPGVRQSANCVISAGGVALNGRVVLQDWSGGRYNLIFMYGDLAAAKLGLFSANMGTYLAGLEANRQLTGSKDDCTFGGAIPLFGFYSYHNGSAVTGSAVAPNNQTGLFPVVNLGYLLDMAAQGCGYTCNYPTSDPLRYAYKFGLVLPTMRHYNDRICRITGKGTTGFTDVNNNLAAAGLAIGSRTYKRGFFNKRVTVYTLTALKHLTISYVYTDSMTNTQNVFAGGQGYDFMGVSDFYFGDREFEMNAGDWFTVVNYFDKEDGIFKKYWNGQHGYGTAIDCTFTVKDDEGVVQTGDTVYLRDNLPEMSLSELCQAYCGLCDLAMQINESAKTLDFIPVPNMLQGYTAVDLDKLPLVEIKSIERYIDGFSRHNYVRCSPADYVTEEMQFKRDYPCENEALDEESEIVVVPFNEGNWIIGSGGAKEAVFDDVEIGENGETHYKGTLSIFYEAAPMHYALHVQTINDEGVGVDTATATRNAVTCRVTARIPFHVFATLETGAYAVLNGREWLIRSATWSGDAADLELVDLNG